MHWIPQVLWLQNWSVSRRKKDLSVVGIVILWTRTVLETAYQSSRGNSSAGNLAGVWQKLKTVHLRLPGLCVENCQMPFYSPVPQRGTVDTFDVHITRITSLSRFHRKIRAKLVITSVKLVISVLQRFRRNYYGIFYMVSSLSELFREF